MFGSAAGRAASHLGGTGELGAARVVAEAQGGAGVNTWSMQSLIA